MNAKCNAKTTAANHAEPRQSGVGSALYMLTPSSLRRWAGKAARRGAPRICWLRRADCRRRGLPKKFEWHLESLLRMCVQSASIRRWPGHLVHWRACF